MQDSISLAARVAALVAEGMHEDYAKVVVFSELDNSHKRGTGDPVVALINSTYSGVNLISGRVLMQQQEEHRTVVTIITSDGIHWVVGMANVKGNAEF